jgi:hypothetical protein
MLLNSPTSICRSKNSSGSLSFAMKERGGPSRLLQQTDATDHLRLIFWCTVFCFRDSVTSLHKDLYNARARINILTTIKVDVLSCTFLQYCIYYLTLILYMYAVHQPLNYFHFSFAHTVVVHGLVMHAYDNYRQFRPSCSLVCIHFVRPSYM